MTNEENRFSARASRYLKVGAGVGGVAARIAGERLFGREHDGTRGAAELTAALGGLKGPLMKVAQLLSTIPEALPAEYARQLSQLQSSAPPMGPAFAKRRMIAELGPTWPDRYRTLDLNAAASASLGQVHRATGSDGRALAVKLQYPDMTSAVEADLTQLRAIFAIHARFNPAIETSGILAEIAARLREELDYEREARHTRLYAHIFANDPTVRVPEIIAALSTKRLLTMTWLDGQPLLDYKGAPLEDRNAIAQAMFRAWWFPFSHYGVIHGDPHLGNYSVFPAPERAIDQPAEDAASPTALPTPGGINLLDYGCIRAFRPQFVAGVIDLYRGLLANDRARIVGAFETWGFSGLSSELIEALTIWARFIYGPLLDDRERTIAEDTTPGEYGRREAFTVHRILKDKGPVRIPREFVFMDRAAIGLGGVFLHLGARQNWYRLFNGMIDAFDIDTLAARQREAFAYADVPLPE